MEHLLKLSSLTPDEIIHILDVAFMKYSFLFLHNKHLFFIYMYIILYF